MDGELGSVFTANCPLPTVHQLLLLRGHRCLHGDPRGFHDELLKGITRLAAIGDKDVLHHEDGHDT